LGFKGTVSERLDYNLSNYCAWVSDELIPFEISGRSFFRNAGKSRHCGVEAQVGWLATDGLTASIQYTFSDFTFTDYVRRDTVFDGNRMPGVPVHQAHGRLSYRSPIDVFGSVEVTYSDAYFADDANTAWNRDYTIFDVRAGYSGRIGSWSLEPFVGINNLFDTRYNTSVVINAAGPTGQQRYFEPGPGRTFYTGLRLPVQIGR
jgi:iron complex outermembrane receptor protein